MLLKTDQKDAVEFLISVADSVEVQQIFQSLKRFELITVKQQNRAMPCTDIVWQHDRNISRNGVSLWPQRADSWKCLVWDLSWRDPIQQRATNHKSQDCIVSLLLRLADASSAVVGTSTASKCWWCAEERPQDQEYERRVEKVFKSVGCGYWHSFRLHSTNFCSQAETYPWKWKGNWWRNHGTINLHVHSLPITLHAVGFCLMQKLMN